jgi:hypothetical protein
MASKRPSEMPSEVNDQAKSISFTLPPFAGDVSTVGYLPD